MSKQNLQSVEIVNLAKSIDKKRLHQHFSDPQNGGGHIDTIVFDSTCPGCHKAIIIFNEESVVDSVLQCEHALVDSKMKRHKLDVRRLPQQVFSWVYAAVDAAITDDADIQKLEQQLENVAYVSLAAANNSPNGYNKFTIRGNLFQIHNAYLLLSGNSPHNTEHTVTTKNKRIQTNFETTIPLKEVVEETRGPKKARSSTAEILEKQLSSNGSGRPSVYTEHKTYAYITYKNIKEHLSTIKSKCDVILQAIPNGDTVSIYISSYNEDNLLEAWEEIAYLSQNTVLQKKSELGDKPDKLEARTVAGKELNFTNVHDQRGEHVMETPSKDGNTLLKDKRKQKKSDQTTKSSDDTEYQASLSAFKTQSTPSLLVEPSKTEPLLQVDIDPMKYIYLFQLHPEEVRGIRTSITTDHQDVKVFENIGVNVTIQGQNRQSAENAVSEIMALYEKAFQNLEICELKFDSLKSQFFKRIKSAYGDLYIVTDMEKLYIAGERENVRECVQFCSSLQSTPANKVTLHESQYIQATTGPDFVKSTESVTFDDETILTVSFELDDIRYLQHVKHNEFKSALELCKTTSIQEGDNEKAVLTLRGKQTDIEKSNEQIRHLLQNVKHVALKYSGSALQIKQVEKKVNESEFNNTYLRIDRDKQQIVIVTDESNVTFVKSKLKDKLNISKAAKAAQSEQSTRRGNLPKNIPGPSIAEIFEFSTVEGITVTVLLRDITTMRADAIVNAANERLDHAGGVAYAIANAAGCSFVRECNNKIKEHGELKVGDCFTSRPGNLKDNCKHIINAVGPCFYDYPNKETCYRDLKTTFTNILEEADSKLKITSVALPLISSGIYGVPKEKCAQMLFKAIVNFSKKRSENSNLGTIFISNFDEETTSVVTEVFKAEYEWDSSNSVPMETTVNKLYDDNSIRVCSVCNIPVSNACKWHIMKCKHVCCKACKEKLHLHVMSECFNCSDMNNTCKVCLDNPADTPLPCNHRYCQHCVAKLKTINPKCPECRQMFGIVRGPQPENGKMSYFLDRCHLPGYEQYETIFIYYNFYDGVQNEMHPNPGHPFFGTERKAYLPASPEGWEVCRLLEKAFKAGHVFTVGTSVTTGEENVVTWNDIHHKTRLYGGPGSFGYPDPGYLARVMEELAAKGFVSEPPLEVTML